MLEAGAPRRPSTRSPVIAHRAVSITAEKVAINAVMAGCQPEYMPVVVAAIEGIADPGWGYHGPGTSTGGAAVLMIVNGPIARELDINAGDNLFGPGWRANLTIGRAVRLVMRNVCGSRPGTLDRGDARAPGQVLLRDRRERGREPVAAAPRRARLPRRSRARSPSWRRRRRTSSTTSSRTPPRGSSPRSATTCASPGTSSGQPQYVVILAGEHMRTIAGGRLDEGGDPAVRLRAHPELARPPQAAPTGWPAPSSRGRDAAAAARRVARTTSSSSRPAGAPAPSPPTFPAGAASGPPRPSPRRSSA